MTWISRRLQQASGGSQGSSQSQVHPLWTQSWRHLVAAFHLCFAIIENDWRRCSWLVYQPQDFSHHCGCQSALCCSSHPTPAACEVSASASPAPTSLTSCGPTLVAMLASSPFLGPSRLAGWDSTQQRDIEVSAWKDLGTRRSAFLGLPSCKNRAAVDHAVGLILPYTSHISHQR